jgi:unsaturated rhamnogalacturonyl hydrolase
MNLRSLPLALGLSLLSLRVAVAATAPGEVLAQMERVADWQLAHPAKEKTDGWVQGAFYTGLAALDAVSAKPAYHAALLAVGRENDWQLGPRPYNADDMCVGQTYLALYRSAHDPAMIAALQARCDAILAAPKDDHLEFSGADKTNRWSWCDALYMAPANWIGLAAATGNSAYRDYMVDHWWKTSAYLYDPQEHLFFRDSTYFAKREPNGQKIFWSRGNGWVLGGLAHVLDVLPAGDPARPRFEQQFRELAERVRGLQQAGGAWASSLLDPSSCTPSAEMSGTGFFCFGFAWGINHGLLDPKVFGPAADAAWQALTGSVTPEGKVTHVQPIGAAPTQFPPDSTEAYGPGAFLLAGAQMYQLRAKG